MFNYTLRCACQNGVVLPLGVHMGMSRYIFGNVWTYLVVVAGWGCAGLSWVETIDAAKLSLMHRTALIQRIILPQMSIEPRLGKTHFISWFSVSVSYYQQFINLILLKNVCKAKSQFWYLNRNIIAHVFKDHIEETILTPIVMPYEHNILFLPLPEQVFFV